MDLIYSMRRKPLKCEPPYFERTSDPEVARPLVTISVCNIIAFSSPTELDDTDSDTWGGHVYVCDMDTPWNSHKVCSTADPVSALKWDCEGKQLLVGTTEGDVLVYGQKDYLLNEWTCLYSTSLPGEKIIAATFFHNGRRVVSVEKKADAPITERIQMLKSAPTVKGFGGVACPGVLFVTATGLVSLASPPPEPGAAAAALHSLTHKRDHYTAADTAHHNGSILICAVRGNAAVCARATLSGPPSRPSLTLQPLPALCPAPLSPAGVSWWIRDDCEWLLVGGSALSLWKLTERGHPVHKLLSKGPVQGSTTPGGGQKPGTDCYNTVAWTMCARWAVGGAGCAGGAGVAGAARAVLASHNKLHLLSPDTHHVLCSRAVPTSGGSVTGPPDEKKAKYGPGVQPGGACATVSSVAMSALGGVTAAVDTHAQIHLFKIHSATHDIPPAVQVSQAVGILEYAAVAGLDCLDVLLALKHNLVEPVYERLTESFQRQPASFQQYYYHSFLKIRIALLRLVPSGQSSVSALSCLQVLQATWAAVCATLRVDEKHDAAVLANSDHPIEHDKALASLEAKPDLGSEALPVSALRRPLRRAADIAATMLALIPHHAPTHGYELYTDPQAISLLRKLIAVARGAGAFGDAALGRLLARLQPGAPKPDLLEECAVWVAGGAWSVAAELHTRAGIAAPHRAPPRVLQYGVEPEALRVKPEPAAALADWPAPPRMDTIRYTYMGARCAAWRQCARCGGRATAHAQPARQPAQRAHDNRQLESCRCGGKWTLFSNV